MKTRFLCLFFLGTAAVRAQTEPQVTTDWLRAMLAEARFDLADDDPATQPRLFTEKLDNGLTWLEHAADTLGAATGGNPAEAAADEPALQDDAVSLLLAEAERMKTAAAARAGSAGEAQYNEARKRYLQGAARLLKFYRQTAGDTFDATAGAITNPADLPDWEMPAGIQLKEIAGSARLNVRTGEFSGRLSGEMEIPALDTRLSVPNLSFDSHGNFDLTAHGAADIPPGDGRAFTLTIPARRPLTVHLSDDGDFRVAGGVQIDLPDGIRLDAFFDADDPRYEFGLGFSGGVTFELAKQVTLIRPTVNFNAAAPLAIEALEGFGQFFGSLGKGLEGFLAETPALPDPRTFEVGRAPDFEVPEAVVPFDSIDAWITGIGNDFVRPAINGTLDATLEPMRDILQEMRAEVASVQTQLAPTLPQIQQMSRLVQLNARARRALAKSAAQQVTGDEGASFLNNAKLTAEEAMVKAEEWLRNLPTQTDLKTGLAVLRLYAEAAGEAGVAGSTRQLDQALAVSRVGTLRTAMLSGFGFGPGGAIADAAKVQALSPEDLRLVTASEMEIIAIEQLFGEGEVFTRAALICRVMFERVRDRYNAAVTRGDIEDRALMAVRLLDMVNDQDLFKFTASAADLQLMANGWTDTFDFIAARGSGGATGQKLAGSFMEAARRLVETQNRGVTRRRLELFGQSPQQNQDSGLSQLDQTYLERVRGAITILQGRGLLTGIALSGYKDRLAAWLETAREQMAAEYPDTDTVERNLNEAAERLSDMADALAFLDDLVPDKVQLIDQFRATWQAHHIKFTGVAEAKKAHWYLSAYAGELAAASKRYGDGTSAALTTAFRVAGTEAMGGLSRTVTALAALTDTLGADEFEFPLPGDLRIDSAHGRLVFNRETGAWEAGFGAKLEFPESEFTLNVKQATLAKNGNFSLSVGTSGNVPLGSSKLQFNVPDFTVSGNTSQQLQFSGNGTLTYNGSAAPGDEFSVGVGVGFNSQTGDVSLNAALNNSPLRFSEDIVLLQGAAGVEFNTQHPEGALTVSGKLGLLARSKPLPAGGLTANQFWLTIDALPTTFAFTEEDMRAEFTGGSITLPADLFTSTAQPGDPPVTLAITGRLGMRYVFATRQVEFSGTGGTPFTLALSNLKLALPELPGFQLLISNATFELSGTQFPRLKSLTATMNLPLPGKVTGQSRTAAVNISGQDWRIDGLPAAASIALASDLRMVDEGGFTFDLLATSASLPGHPTAFSLTRTAANRLLYRLEGTIRAAIAQEMLTRDTDNAQVSRVAATISGHLAWDFHGTPDFAVDAFDIAGTFRLGGRKGMVITGSTPGTDAHLRISGLTNLFNQAADRPFKLTIEGALDIPDIAKFSLFETSFAWIGRANGVPDFIPGGFGVVLNQKTIDLIAGILPAYPTELRLRIKNGTLPLFPTGNNPGLFSLTNIQLGLSGEVNLPNKAALDSGSPGLAGAFQDLVIDFTAGTNGLPVAHPSINSLGLQVRNLELGPIGGVEGGVAIGNLRFAGTNPEKLFFAGQLKGRIQQASVELIVAFRPTGLIGCCLAANAGPAGIPIDGGALGGLMLNGAKGGVSFSNRFSDPTEFSNYFKFNSDGSVSAPGGDPNAEIDFNSGPTGTANPSEASWDSLVAAGGQAGSLVIPSCVTGTFPPDTINPLCQRHSQFSNPNSPYRNRIIFKGTETTAAALGFSAGDPRLQGTFDQVLDNAEASLTGPIQNGINTIIGAAPLPPDQKEVLEDWMDHLLETGRRGARQAVVQAFERVTGANPNATMFQIIDEAARAGIACLDITLVLGGTFTHLAVPSIIEAEGTVVLSTTGTVLADIEMRGAGMRFAHGQIAYSLTDRNGAIDPSMASRVTVELGPVKAGEFSAALSSGGFVSLLDIQVRGYLTHATNALGADAKEFLIALMDNVARRATSRSRSIPLPVHYDDLSNAERMAWFGQILNVMRRVFVPTDQPLLLPVTPQTMLALLGDPNAPPQPVTEAPRSLLQLIANMMSETDFRYCASGGTGLEIFGFPISSGLGGGSLFLGKVQDPPVTGPKFYELTMNGQISPSALVGFLMSGNSYVASATAIDQAQMGYSFRMPAWTPQRVNFALTNPVGFAADTAGQFAENAVLAFGYQFQPFGFRLADGQGRVVLPRLLDHPKLLALDSAKPDWPGAPDRDGADAGSDPDDPQVATRAELILAALNAGQLMNPRWRGTTGELDDLFFNQPPPASPDSGAARVAAIKSRLSAAKMSNLSFGKDYFPHGGMIGGAQMQLPRFITDAPPFDNFARIFTVPNFSNQADVNAWVAAANAVKDYLTQTRSTGQLAFYLPSPNPPWTTLAQFNELGQQGLFAATQMDAAQLQSMFTRAADVTNFYPITELTFEGWLQAQVLGLQLGEGTMRYRQPSPGTPAGFIAKGGVPAGSWLSQFLTGSVEMTLLPPPVMTGQANPLTSAPIDELIALFPAGGFTSGGVSQAGINNLMAKIDNFTPKASFEAAMNVALPANLSTVLKAGAGAKVFAFTPRYEPQFNAGSEQLNRSPYAISRRTGGFGIAGNFDFGFFPGGDPAAAGAVRITVQNASLAVRPELVGFPSLSGQLLVPTFALPGLPQFSDGELSFANNPEPGGAFLVVSGQMQPFSFMLTPPLVSPAVEMLKIVPIAPATKLGATVKVLRNASGSGASAGVVINPCRATMPFLGQNVALSLYGCDPVTGVPGSTADPFTFFTQSRQDWCAAVTLSAANNLTLPPAFQICDPKTNGGICSLQFTPTAPLTGIVRGKGLDSFSLEVKIPVGFDATFFPGQPTATTHRIGGSGVATLFIEKTPEGKPRFYVDFGDQQGIGLPGIMTAGGRFEFGYNPDAVSGNVTLLPATQDFGSVEVCRTGGPRRTFTLTNNSGMTQSAVIRVEPVSDWSVTSSGFTLTHGQSRTVDVIFRPSRVANPLTGTLFVEMDDFSASSSLSGIGFAFPTYFQSSTALNYPDTLVGGESAASVTIGNGGCAPLEITGIATSNSSVFPVSVVNGGTFPLSVLPGKSRQVRVIFRPAAFGTASGTITIATSNGGVDGTGKPNGVARNYTLPLSGRGTSTRWLTILDSATTGSTAALNDIHMIDSQRGWVGGDNGITYETKNGGRSWIPRVITAQSIRRITSTGILNDRPVVELHLEEPSGSRAWRDDSGNGRNATSIGTPVTGLANGRIGSGVDLNGTSAGLEFPAFNPATAFTAAFWVNPAVLTGSPVFLGKTSAAGARQFSLGIAASGSTYELIVDGVSRTFGTPQAGVWQHIGMNVSGINTYRCYVNGALALTTTIGSGFHGTWSTGNGWTIGHDFTAAATRGRFLRGRMDEIYFFDAAINVAEMLELADGGVPMKLLMTGTNGTALESRTRGRSWSYLPDQNVNGWRQSDGVFHDYIWNAAALDSAGKILLAGSQPGTIGFPPPRQSALLLEDLFTGNPGTADDRFDDVLFSSGVTEIFNDVITDAEGREFVFSSTGRVYRSPSGVSTGTWTPHNTTAFAGSLLDAEAISSGSDEVYIATGVNGLVIRSVNGAVPTAVTVSPLTGLTPAATAVPTLRQADWTGTASSASAPALHAVGDAYSDGTGNYLTSDNFGSTWIAVNDGLRGSFNGIDVRTPESGAGYEAWVAGAANRIDYRPVAELTSSFLTFYPGELNFGFLQLGQAKTLPMRVTNRGKRALTITGVAITGTDFELAQALTGSVSLLQPGDSITLQVRYKPDAVSNHDLGEIALTVNEGGSKTFRAALTGRSDSQSWRPLPLSSGGAPITGTVVDLHARNSFSFYALVDSPNGSRLFDGTTAITLPSPPGGQVYRLKAMDWHPRTTSSTDDLGIIVGEARRTSDGTLVGGVVLRTLNSGASFQVRNPPDVTLGFRDVDIQDDDELFAAVTSGTTATIIPVGQPTGTVFKTRNSTATTPTWTTNGGQPSSFFIGNVVRCYDFGFTDPLVFGVSDSQIYTTFAGSSWSGSTAWAGQQTVRDFSLRKNTGVISLFQSGWIVGDSGMFWRWERFGNELHPFEGDSLWTPASNQEVFGRTNLAGVHFPVGSSTGFICGGSRIYASFDDGKSWDLDFDAGSRTVMDCVETFFRPATTSHLAINSIEFTQPALYTARVGSSVEGKAVVWTLNAGSGPAAGVLSANDVEIWNPLEPGGTVTKAVTLRNIGNAALPVHSVSIRDINPSGRYRLLNNPPASIAAGGSFDLQVEFAALPDPVDPAVMDARAFLRFEQDAQAVQFTDSSVSQAHGRLPANGSNAPHAETDETRGTSVLALDGNDYLEVPGAETFTGSFSLAAWVNPATTADGQVFFGKHASNGADRFVCQFLNNAYHFKLKGATANFGIGLKKTGWQHLAVTGQRIGSTGDTAVTFWRDGEILGTTTTLPGVTADDIAGLPWLLGAERDGALTGNINEFLNGRLDDFCVFDRVLTESEILRLTSTSPACGEHRAQLVISSGSEEAERIAELRASVNETSGVVVIDTEPSGQRVLIDGVERLTPATFAVRCASRNPSEWMENSLHTISAPASFDVISGADTLGYVFTGWGKGTLATTTITARPGDARYIGRYIVRGLSSGAGFAASPPPPSGDEGVVLVVANQGAEDGDVAARIAGTPAGPWFRLTEGELNIAGMAGGSGMDITGDLFVSASRIRGSVQTSAVSLPDTGANKFLEIGPSLWKVDFRAGAGGKLNLLAQPSSVKVLGNDILPSGELLLELEPASDIYRFKCRLLENYAPVPGFFEIHRVVPSGGGQPTAGFAFQRNANGSFTVNLDGMVRVLKTADASQSLTVNGTPTAFAGTFAANAGGAFTFTSPGENFSISLRQMLGANLPTTFFSNGPFSITGGDLMLSRTGTGVQLTFAGPSFRLNGTTLAQVNGQISTSGEISLTGTAPGNLQMPLGDATFSVSSKDGNPVSFGFTVFSRPEPGFRLSLPALRLTCTLPDPGNLSFDMPALVLDTSGQFDTGKLRLPSFTFDGIGISNQGNGGRDDNYIRLRRTGSGKLIFNTEAQIKPHSSFPTHQFSLTAEKPAGGGLSVQASLRGNFLVLPFKVSLGFDSGSSFQFSIVKEGWMARFGTGGVEVWGGVEDDGSGGVRVLDL